MLDVLFDTLTIGPDERRGLTGHGKTPEVALWALAALVDRFGWCFDPTWKPDGRGFHDG